MISYCLTACCLLPSLDGEALHAARRELRTGARDLAGIDAGPAELTGEAAVFDLGATIHDDLQVSGLGLGGCLVVAHAELHSEDFKAELVLERDRLARDGQRSFRVAEAVDDVDGRGHIGESGVHLLAE